MIISLPILIVPDVGKLVVLATLIVVSSLSAAGAITLVVAIVSLVALNTVPTLLLAAPIKV